MHKKFFGSILVILAVLSVGCGNKEVDTKATLMESSKVAVEKVHTEQTTALSEISGTLKPNQDTYVAFEVPGRVTALKKKEGDDVKIGELVAKLDGENYKIGVDQASAGAEQANAALKQVEKGARTQEVNQVKAAVAKAQAGYDKALADYARVKALYKEGAVPQNLFDDAGTGLKVAQEDLDTAKQAYSLVLAGATPEVRDQTKAAYAGVVSAKKQAELALAKTSLKSTLQGTIISKLASEGQLVAAGTPVYRIGDVDTLKVILPVPDNEIKSWSKGDKTTLSLYNESREGQVINIYPATNQGTGTISVEVSLPNPKHDWFSGQVVTAKHSFTNGIHIFVPVEAVISRGEGGQYVFRFIGQKAVKTLVKVGDLVENKFEILSGLKSDDTIVVKGADRLYDGQKIESAGK